MRATLEYTEPLVRRAVRSFWWRHIGWGFIGATGSLGVCVTYLVIQGDRSWVVGLFGATLIFALLVAATLYVTHMRASLGRLRQMRRPMAELEITNSHLRVVTDQATSELAWELIREVWQFPDFWLLLVTKNQFMTLPLQGLSAEHRDRILASVEEAKRRGA